MASSEAVATYLNIVLYAVSYQLQRPVEPYLVRSLLHSDASNANHSADEESAANRTYGRLTSFFSLIQTVGSPLVGTLLDRIGPKRTSILVYAGSALSYWILAHATTPGWLYFSKVPTLLQHAFLVGQATVASIPDEGEGSSARRAAALGRMTTAYTVGATIGPALGGYLASSDLYAGARLAVWGSLISVLLSVVFLKDHTEKGKDDSEEKTQQLRTQRSFLQSVHKTLSFLRHPTIGPLLFIKTFNGVSSSAFSTILPLILANKLHFSPAQLGYFNGFVAETNATNLFLVRCDSRCRHHHDGVPVKDKICCDGAVLVTPNADACLPGITRETVLLLAKELGIETEVRRVSLSEFYSADEVFTTGTMGELTPVTVIDGRVIGSSGVKKRGIVTDVLQKAYKEAIKQRLEWSTEIPPFS